MPPIIRAVSDLINACLDEHAECVAMRNGRGFTASERAAWLWLDSAIELPQVAAAAAELDGEAHRYFACLLYDYAQVVHPDQDANDDMQPVLFSGFDSRQLQ